MSVTDFRYRSALRCLAVVAANPAALPPYALISDGISQVTDTATASSQTLWNRTINSFASETFMALWSRNPQPNWTVDPITDHEQLETVRCACRWALFGRAAACNGCESLLASPLQDPSPGSHFGVAWRLERLPPCWFHVGRLKDVPLHTCYKAHCHGTWVWVMPDGMEGLSQFTLVLQDIATLNPAKLSPPQVTIDLVRQYSLGHPGLKFAVTGERRTVKRAYLDKIEDALLSGDEQADVNWDEYTEPADSTALRTNVSPAGGGYSANIPSHVTSPRMQGLQNLRSTINASSFPQMRSP